MQAYLFVHFKETRSPEGEQVYFGISTDGFHWESVNNANPILWSYEGDKGVRDFTITRTKEGKFVILATDLSLAYGFRYKYKNSWAEISVNGSKDLVMWQSDDLIHWSPQKMLHLGNEDFGCLWAPDIIYDRENDDYVIHWSSSHRNTDFKRKDIYYSRTKDFENFTEAKVLYSGENQCIDSAMYEENGKYYMFVKGMGNPVRVFMLESDHVTGPFRQVEAFDKCMEGVIDSTYEAPTAVKMPDGKWALFLDFFGTKNASEQGYVPFISDDISSGIFVRSDKDFSFPYGYKHGTILPITMEEYERLKTYIKSPNEF